MSSTEVEIHEMIEMGRKWRVVIYFTNHEEKWYEKE